MLCWCHQLPSQVNTLSLELARDQLHLAKNDCQKTAHSFRDLLRTFLVLNPDSPIDEAREELGHRLFAVHTLYYDHRYHKIFDLQLFNIRRQC